MENIKELITEIREDRTMKEFAALLEVSVPTISRYESGERTPTVAAFGKLLMLATLAQRQRLLEAIGATNPIGMTVAALFLE